MGRGETVEGGAIVTVGAGILASTAAKVAVAAGPLTSTISGSGLAAAFSVGGGGDGVASSWPQATRTEISNNSRNGAALSFNRFFLLRSHFSQLLR